jgi:hypothetical protein
MQRIAHRTAALFVICAALGGACEAHSEQGPSRGDAAAASVDAHTAPAPADGGDARVAPLDATAPLDAVASPIRNSDAMQDATSDATTADASTSSAECSASLCESFETATLDAQRWELVTPSCSGTGQVSLDATQAHAGSRSLRVQGAAGYCNHVFVRPRAAIWQPSDPLYGRFYLRIANPLGQGHVTLLALHDTIESKDLRMGGQSEVVMWNRESDDATLPELSPAGIALSARPTTGSWLCVEFLIDAKRPALQTWLNGQELEGLHLEGAPTPEVDAQWQRKSDWHPQLSDLRLGWESYGSDANTVWFDDLAFGSSRIGCGP